MISISSNLNVMIKAVEKASKILIRDFGEVEKLQVSKKGPYDFVRNKWGCYFRICSSSIFVALRFGAGFPATHTRKAPTPPLGNCCQRFVFHCDINPPGRGGGMQKF